jgi:DNA transposition AAA+ family ATPase
MYTNPQDNELPSESEAPPQLEIVSPVTPNVPDRTTNTSHIKMTAHDVEIAYAPHVASGSVTEEQVAQIVWLLGVGKIDRVNLETLSKRIGYEGTTTLFRVFRADYKGSLVNVLERIASYRQLWEQRLAIGMGEFVPTSISDAIWQHCDAARIYNTIIPVYGPSQLGKSVALYQYAKAHNHGKTFYMRVPTCGFYSKFVRELNRVMGQSTSVPTGQLHTKPFDVLNGDKLLIVDEIHQTVLKKGRMNIRIDTLEYIREVYDMTGCGIILCGTDVFRNEVERSQYKEVLEQLFKRTMTELVLPNILPRKDLDAIAAPFGLDPAPDAIQSMRVEIVQNHGLRTYTNYLKAGARLAQNSAQKFDWPHFVSAHDALAKNARRTRK